MKDFTRRQKEIIETSVNLIAKGGIQELTIKNISKEIGISEPAIYRHFESKIEILTSILIYFEALTSSVVEKVFSEEKSSLTAIENFFKGLIDLFTDNPSLTRVIFSEEIFQNDQKLSDMVLLIMKNHQKKILPVIERGQLSGEIRDDIPKEHIAMISMGTFRLLVTRWRLDNFSFNLKEKGEDISLSIKKLIGKS